MASVFRAVPCLLSLSLAAVGCTATPPELDGLTFGSGNGPDPDDGGTDTEGPMPKVSEGDESAGNDDSGSTGDDGGSDSSDPTGVSDDCTPGDTADCYGGPDGTLDVGPCQSGTQTCQADGTWGDCEGAVLPAAETCNELDDDCSGQADDGNPGGGDACETGLLGACSAGTLQCTSGEVVCEADVTAAPSETCGDDVDNDCNGTVDDGCQAASSCNPRFPGQDCDAGERCYPSTTGDTSCQGPTGLATQYDRCTSDDQCAPDHVCVDTGSGSGSCLQWCRFALQCPFLFDACVSLSPAVFAGAEEFGVCYDGLG